MVTDTIMVHIVIHHLIATKSLFKYSNKIVFKGICVFFVLQLLKHYTGFIRLLLFLIFFLINSLVDKKKDLFVFE